jgi:hypothetical protein
VQLQPTELAEFRKKVAGVSAAGEGVDRLIRMLGPDSDIFTNPTARAKATPVIKKLILDLKKDEAVRGLPPQDIAFFESMVGDPNAITPASVVGLAKNRERLKSFKAVLQRDLQTSAKALGLQETRGSRPASAADARSMLKPGERLVADPNGRAHALGSGEQLPAGWNMVP